MNKLITILCILTLLSCSNKDGKNTENNNSSAAPDSALLKTTDKDNAQAEGARPENFRVSGYTADLENVPNIERPDKSSIKNFRFNQKDLFQNWVEDSSSNAHHATFRIDRMSFFLVDFDGSGDMPYEIENDSITVYFNDFIRKGRIVDVKKDELDLHWNGAENATKYYRWKY